MKQSKSVYIGIVVVLFCIALSWIIVSLILPSGSSIVQTSTIIGGIFLAIIGVLAKLPAIISFFEDCFFSRLELIKIRVIDDPAEVMDYRKKELGQSLEEIKGKMSAPENEVQQVKGTNPIIELTLRNPTKRRVELTKVNFDVERIKKGLWNNPKAMPSLFLLPVSAEYDITFDPRRSNQQIVCEVSQSIKTGDADRFVIVVGHKYDSNYISEYKACQYETRYKFSVFIEYNKNDMIVSENEPEIYVSSQFNEGHERDDSIIILP
jgi:hypothetical protein